MQTNFSLAQLADPHTAASEKILRTCVHCGFCTATCPTYLLLGDELDSPRGRIYLMKDMLENERPATREVVKHIDRCLSCLSCMTTCPSGVHYMHLVDHGRAYIEKTYTRAVGDRLTRSLLAFVLPNRKRFRVAIALSRLGKPFEPLLRRVPGLERFAAMLRLAPARRSKSAPPQGVFPVQRPHRARVVLHQGCVQPILMPSINASTIGLLTRLGVEVVQTKNESCCGALVHHMGREHDSHDQARRMIDLWWPEIEQGLDAIIITASGCGTTVKDYGFMLREDMDYAGKAARVSHLAQDVTEFLADLRLPPPQKAAGMAVAYHSACSMQHGQGIREQPKQLLREAGFSVRDVAEGHICCGSAGTYNILQPELAARLRDRKAENIRNTGASIVATGNIGCITQLKDAIDIPIVHTVELLDWVHGGPMPTALAGAGR